MTACESAGELGVFSKVLVAIAVGPEEISANNNRLLLVGIGESSRDFFGLYVFIVADINVVLGPVSVWVHHIDKEWFVSNVLYSCIFVPSVWKHHLMLRECVDMSSVLILNLIDLGTNA